MSFVNIWRKIVVLKKGSMVKVFELIDILFLGNDTHVNSYITHNIIKCVRPYKIDPVQLHNLILEKMSPTIWSMTCWEDLLSQRAIIESWNVTQVDRVQGC